MNHTAASDLYRCHWCIALNDGMKADWCLCATSQRTLVCSSCSRCFCTAPAMWTRTFWELASPNLVARRRRESRDAESDASDHGPLQRPVILVVDDDKVVHAIVDRVLANFSGTILHAHDGAEGLRIARAVQPEILLTDALLPKLDGRELTRTLKDDPNTANIRAVVMTALYKGARYRTEAFQHFLVDAYMEKPVSAEKLRSVIDEMLGALSLERLAS